MRVSDPDDWHVIWGPTYLDATDVYHDSADRREHTGRAVYRPDVNLGLAWGMPREERFEWAESPFPDKWTTNEYVDVLWAGMLIDRITVTAVDDHRALLPPATPEVIQGEDGNWLSMVVIGEHATEWDAHLTRLVHSLSGAQPADFDQHVRMANIAVIADPKEQRDTSW